MVIFYSDFDYELVIIKSKPPLIPPYEGGLDNASLLRDDTIMKS
jgi:hypothetical protein